MAKAVKSDDAPIPVHLFDEQVFRGPPTPEQSKSLVAIRMFMMKLYKQRLYLECLAFIKAEHGEDCFARIKGEHTLD